MVMELKFMTCSSKYICVKTRKKYSYAFNYDVLIITNVCENSLVTVVEIHSPLSFASNRI
jgi:hypothetical protein